MEAERNRTRIRVGDSKRRRKTVVCNGCHRTIRRIVRDAGRYCSRECAFRVKGLVAEERAALRRIGSNWAWRPSALVLAEVAALRRIAAYVERPATYSVACLHCDATFTTRRNGGLHRKVCAGCKAESERRAKRAAKARRRAAKRGSRCERFDPIEVLERDGWRCQLCGVRTPRRLRGTLAPRAPELDHVIPLAVGGEHSRANTQCACRACNNAKGARPLGQLLLVA